ncbi:MULTISPECIES: hypothetical protein [unclassified Pseudovibrio]|uniref:hypothetical protein n=1 Tax=unclassified Pseudovibrio TaxID=2627060 RepID=UPI0007AEB612|nr:MULTISPECIES: hypothetical protein [unclassified Pseudovibrio]KZK97308.1 hypothetical protein PsW74_03748 [Pseudovibrio sp. W74]KZL08994.1 hypothetical protein PsAD14_02573 [Pseudovibrio sp. Ad14]
MSNQQMGYDLRREHERFNIIKEYWNRRGHQICGIVSVNHEDGPTQIYTTTTDMKNGCPVGHPANRTGAAL